jgi:hypothetical protein
LIWLRKTTSGWLLQTSNEPWDSINYCKFFWGANELAASQEGLSSAELVSFQRAAMLLSLMAGNCWNEFLGRNGNGRVDYAFWYVTPCRLVGMCRVRGGTIRLLLQVRLRRHRDRYKNLSLKRPLLNRRYDVPTIAGQVNAFVCVWQTGCRFPLPGHSVCFSVEACV